MRSDDLTPLLTPQQVAELGFRQGRVLFWDPLTGDNRIEIAGQSFDDLPVLATTSIALTNGDLVAVLRYQSTYLLLGRVNTVGNQRGNLAVAGTFGASDVAWNSWPSTTSATYEPLHTAWMYRGGAYLLTYARTLVGVNSAGHFAVQLNGVTMVETAVYTGGASGAIGAANLQFVWPADTPFGQPLRVDLVARRTSGADKLAASVQGAWKF